MNNNNYLLTVLTGLFFCISSYSYAENPVTTNTTTAQGLGVTITAPAGPVDLNGSPVLIDTVATLGAVPPTPVNFIYVLDLSGSMEFNQIIFSGEPDCNGNGNSYTYLDAACLGLIALNNSLSNAANIEVALVGFGGNSSANSPDIEAYTADVDPADGHQTLITPPQADNNNNTIPDIEEVIRSAQVRRIFQFTPNQAAIGLATNYQAALEHVNAIVDSAPEDEINIVAFISDGAPNVGDYQATTALPTTISAGTIVHTFAIGQTASAQCNADRPLGIIAADTNGSCSFIQNPADLQTVLPEVLTTKLQNLELFVNGISVASTTGSEPLTMNLDSVDVSSALAGGSNRIEATALTEDGTTITADVNLQAIDELNVSIDIKPNNPPNVINLKSRGKLQVAIFSNSDFDATTVQTSSLELSGATVSLVGKKSRPMRFVKDVNNDGLNDLVVYFNTAELDLTDAAEEASLTGHALIDGNSIKIVGTDIVRIVNR